MEPARKIIEALGGAAKVAAFTGVHRTRPYSWMKAKEVGGTGGIIPMKYVPALLCAAAEKGIPLSFEDFSPLQNTERS